MDSDGARDLLPQRDVLKRHAACSTNFLLRDFTCQVRRIFGSGSVWICTGGLRKGPLVTANLDSGKRLLVYPVRCLEVPLPDDRVRRMDAFSQIISKLESKRNSKIFSIIHCGEEDNHICHPTLMALLDERDKFKNLQTLELLLHSP